MVYQEFSEKTKSDIGVMALSDDRKLTPFLHSEFNEVAGQLSPDNRWMAYASDDSGSLEIYVTSFPTSGGKRRISDHGGSRPRWRRDGKELFYVSGDRDLMAVDVSTSSGAAAFSAGSPKRLFHLPIGGVFEVFPDYGYDVTADGQRFLVNKFVEATPASITLATNWTAALRK